MQYVNMLDKEVRASPDVATPRQHRIVESPPANRHGQLAKYPSIVNLERTTGVPKAYAVVGAISLYMFLILLNLGGQLLTNMAGFVIPGYYSMAALFTSNTDDDTQWLTVRNPLPIAPLDGEG